MKDDRLETKEIAALEPYGKITLIMFVALLLTMMVIAGVMIFTYLLAILIGGLLALLCFPLFRHLTRLGVRPRLAASTVTLGVILVILIPLSLMIFLAVKQGLVVANALASNEDFSFRNIFDLVNSWPLLDTLFGSHAAAKKKLFEWMQAIGLATISTTVSLAANAPKLILQLVLTIISFFFFLLDGPRFIFWLSERIPLDHDVRRRVAISFNETAVSTIWAILAAGTVQSLIMFLAFLVLGVPAIFLATAATFILAWIPILGSTPVWLLGTLYLWQQGFFIKAILMLAFGVIIGISDNFVRPLVLQGRANMHPLVSLVAIFGGIGLFGIFGVFIGPIVAAVLISFLQIWPAVGERYSFMMCKSTNEIATKE